MLAICHEIKKKHTQGINMYEIVTFMVIKAKSLKVFNYEIKILLRV